jgi:hypothetical protein
MSASRRAVIQLALAAGGMAAVGVALPAVAVTSSLRELSEITDMTGAELYSAPIDYGRANVALAAMDPHELMLLA